MLVRGSGLKPLPPSSTGPAGDTSAADSEVLTTPTEEGCLRPEDVQAFLNRVFLDAAVPINPLDMTAALHHLLALLDSRESIRVLDFLADKVVELSSLPTGVSLLYRFLSLFLCLIV